MSRKVLITGATGNTGLAVIEHLMKIEHDMQVIAGVRDREKALKTFNRFEGIELERFDFEDPWTFENALEGIDTVFLLRPPHISDVNKYFQPLISKMKEKEVPRVVFLSVQGVEKSPVIPHHKIEKLIQNVGLDYIFLRPGYFMQNLTTTLLKDIRTKGKIVLPAGKAKFNWIDVDNIGEAGAVVISEFDKWKNQGMDITGLENLDFGYVANLITEITGKRVDYNSTNPVSFYSIKRRQGMSSGLITVMILLHFLPRFQKEPQISDFYEKITGKKPNSVRDFLERERELFLNEEWRMKNEE